MFQNLSKTPRRRYNDENEAKTQMANSVILGLDIGSENIKTVIAESGSGKLRLSYASSKKSSGLRRGSVVDMDEAKKAVGEALKEIRGFYKPAIKNIYVSISGCGGHYEKTEGTIALGRPGAVINKGDMMRAEMEAATVPLAPNRKVLHTLVNEYIVDGAPDIKDPIGMSAAKLKVSGMVIDIFTPSYKNLEKIVRSVGGEISGVVYAPLSAAISVLTKSQKENGVALIDIGSETTSLVVYEDNKLIHLNSWPVGSKNISNDLAIALQIPIEAADKLKVTYGYAVSHDVSSRDTIDLKKIDVTVVGTPSRRYVSEVIEARLEEIFELIDKDLVMIGKSRKLPSGIVLTGGGAKLPGIAELAKHKFKLSTQIGIIPTGLFEIIDHNLLEYVESPEYAVVLGLIMKSEDVGDISLTDDEIFGKVKRFLRNIIP